MSNTADKKDAVTLAMEALSMQQRKFVAAYCTNGFNATKAAVTAGYSPKTATEQGSRLLTSVKVKAAIQAIAELTVMGPGEIAARWDRIARASLDDFYEVVQVEHTPRIEKPLAEVVAEYRKHVEFEQALAIRSEALISNAKVREKFRKSEQVQQLLREQKLLRLEMELEQDPNGTRFVNGPKEWRDELQLNLVKAKAAGLLELVKGVKPGQFGMSVEMRDPDAALTMLAKYLGMLTDKLDITSQGESVAPKDLSGLTQEDKLKLLEIKRKLAAGKEVRPNG